MNIEVNEDWEEWDPQASPFHVHMLAGSIAGAAEHLVVFPVDTIKTFLQTEGNTGKQELKELVKTHGFRRLWRGVSTTLVGCIPAHAGYFSIYEWGKVAFGANGPNHAPLAAASTGILATIAHDAVMSPMDVVKQRLQLGFHANIFDAFRTIWKSEGGSALFRSFPTTLAMNMPFAAVSISSNESLRRIINPSGEYSFSTFVSCGIVSGGLAGFFTTPFDVVRTRLNVQYLHSALDKSSQPLNAQTSRFASRLNASVVPSALLSSARRLSGTIVTSVHNNRQPTYGLARLKYTRPIRCPTPIALWASPGTSTLVKPTEASGSVRGAAVKSVQSGASYLRYAGPIQAAKEIWAKEGYRGFFRGARQRVAVMAPGFAISWTSYETVKAVLLSGSAGHRD